jgi:hypothetical protein
MNTEGLIGILIAIRRHDPFTSIGRSIRSLASSGNLTIQLPQWFQKDLPVLLPNDRLIRLGPGGFFCNSVVHAARMHHFWVRAEHSRILEEIDNLRRLGCMLLEEWPAAN